MRAELGSVYENLKDKRADVQACIQDVLPLGNGLFKVVAAVNAVRSEEQFAECIARETEGGARLVAGSMSTGGRIVAAVVRANARSRPMDGSMTMVTACTASDDHGRIWSVVNDGSGRRAVLQESADDLEAILRERMATRTIVANPAEGRGVSTAGFVNGDLVRYVDVDSGKTECALAFHVGSETIGVNARAERTRIHPGAIMQSVEAARLGHGAALLQAEVASTALTSEELDTAIAFLGRAGILSDQMADRMRALSNTPQPQAA